jgi:hypothetical protein
MAAGLCGQATTAFPLSVSNEPRDVPPPVVDIRHIGRS